MSIIILNKISYTDFLCNKSMLRCVEHSEAQFGESSDLATAARYSVYKRIQQQNRRKMKNVTIVRSKNVCMVPWS